MPENPPLKCDLCKEAKPDVKYDHYSKKVVCNQCWANQKTPAVPPPKKKEPEQEER